MNKEKEEARKMYGVIYLLNPSRNSGVRFWPRTMSITTPRSTRNQSAIVAFDDGLRASKAHAADSASVGEALGERGLCILRAWLLPLPSRSMPVIWCFPCSEVPVL